MLTLKSCHQEKKVMHICHVQKLTSVQHLATRLLLTRSSLNATFVLQLSKKEIFFTSKWLLSKNPAAIWSFPTCQLQRIPCTLELPTHREIFLLVNQHNATVLSHCYIRSFFTLCVCVLVLRECVHVCVCVLHSVKRSIAGWVW